MAINQLPPKDGLADGEVLQVPESDGLFSTYQLDKNTCTFFSKEAQVIIPGSHGSTHVSTDLVPLATKDLQGHMSADDKCRLDTLLQMRIGVLGFQGAGFPDDGGFLSGDIILAAGNELINLERVGNIIRFTVENSIQFCGCEECANIFWIKDESEPRAIRPPSCNGVLPDIAGYGEIKIYQLPESTILDPADPLATLSQKGNFPALIFKRYDDALTPEEAEFEMVLKRDTDKLTFVGWAFTPGPTGIPECVWTMGADNENNKITFKLSPESEPGLLGALLYKGHTLTRQMAVVTGFTSSVLSTNQYKAKKWDVKNAVPIGDEFVATNVWQYNNPENTTTNPTDPKTLVLDATRDVHPIGTLIQIWEFLISEVNGERCTRSFFNLPPTLNPAHLWSLGGVVQFGDQLQARRELTQTTGGNTELTSHNDDVTDERLFEKTVWGITTFEDRLILSDDNGSGDPSAEPINNLFVADIDRELPGLTVIESNPGTGPVVDNINERPVFLWHRGNHKNILFKSLIGMPDESDFPPMDILLRAPVDSFDDTYLKVTRRGIFATGPFAGSNFIVVKGMRWEDLPQTGDLRILTGASRNVVWRYEFKAAFSPFDDDGITLIGLVEFSFGNTGDTPDDTTVVELLHVDYTAPCVRLEFSVNQTTGDETVQLQVKVGTLDMSEAYKLNKSLDPADDLVRGLQPGFTVSDTLTQTGFITDGIGVGVESNPVDFRVFSGGFLPAPIDGDIEKWNELIIMFRDTQCWIWWNGRLIPPSAEKSAELTTPVAVSTPYFPLTPIISSGKIAMRMWPGTKIREISVRDQITLMSEFTLGQLELS